MQPDEAVSAAVPAGQLTQLVSPGPSAYLPAAQAAQAAEPAAPLYVPGTHCGQVPWPATVWAEPAGQAAHDVEVAAE